MNDLLNTIELRISPEPSQALDQLFIFLNSNLQLDGEAFPEIVELLSGRTDLLAELFVFNTETIPAAGTGDGYTLLFKPGNRLIEFLAAAGARNLDLRAGKHVFHGETPGCVDDDASTTSTLPPGDPAKQQTAHLDQRN